MRNSKALIIIGLLSSFAGGVVVGMLFAPQSGVATRRRLQDEASRAAERARDLAEIAGEKAGVVGTRVDHYLGRDEEVAWRKLAELREGVQRYTQTQGS